MAINPSDVKSADEFIKGLWRENPVFIAVLGLCPAMTETNTLTNGIIMCAATLFVLVRSSILISLLRGVIPKEVRVPFFIIVIATFVTTIDYVLQAVALEAHKELGAFISLIVVNCLILGRQEAFASKNTVKLSLYDAAGMSVGFSVALCMIGAMRELLGMGSLLGINIMGDNFEPWAIMVMPPGGFLSLGALLVFFAYIKTAQQRRKDRAAEGGAA